MNAKKRVLLQTGCQSTGTLTSIIMSAVPGGCAPGLIQTVSARFPDPAQRRSCQS